ncbi:MAG: transporter, partial [Caulobacter sp.]|nr:transporter [Caulobacter sp.]
LNAAILLALLVYAFRQAALKRAGTGDAQDEATLAGLERGDEGGV